MPEDRRTTMVTQTPPTIERNGAGDEPPQGKRRATHLLLGLLALVLIVAGGSYYLHSRHYESTDDAYIEGHVIQISPRVPGMIQAVKVTDNQEVKAGETLLEIDPRDYAAKLEQTRAMLASAEARLGQARINVGLTSNTTSAGVEQAVSGVDQARSGLTGAQAAVAAARSGVAQARARLAAAQADVAQAQADVGSAAADTKRAEDDYKRYRELIKDGAVSQQQLDYAETAAKSAKAKLDSQRQKVASSEAAVGVARAALHAAEGALSQAEAGVGEARGRIGEASGKLASANTAPQQVAVSQAQLKGLEAELKQAQAAVDQAELNLSYTRVTAPEAGRVTRKSAEAGAYVQTGQALLAIVPRQVWVVANFKETQLTRMRPNQPVTIKVDAYPGMDLKGHVDSIQSGTGARFSLLPPENATGNYVKVVQRVPVKIVLDELPDNGRVLAPGMSVVPKVKVR